MTKAIFRFAVTVLAAAALMTVSTGAQGQGGAGRAGGAPAAAPAQPDFSQVQIKTTKLADNFYTLEGQGGTIGALVGPDGVFMVDASSRRSRDKIVAAIKQISDGRSGSSSTPTSTAITPAATRTSASWASTILSRPQLRARLVKPSPAANGTTPPSAPAAALPVVTYDAPDHRSHERRGHPADSRAGRPHRRRHDGAISRTADVIMTGDFFRSTGYPNIDRANGGSLNGMLDGLRRLSIDSAGPDTKIIPGHGADRRQGGRQRAPRHDHRAQRQSGRARRAG